MKDEKNYYIELHASGFKYTDKFSGFDEACAHFSSKHDPDSNEFYNEMTAAVFEIGDQQVDHGWTGWKVGKLFVQDGWRDADVMSPEWEYHRGRSLPTYREVREYVDA